MMNFVHSAFQDADILIYMVEIGEKGLKDEKLFEKIKKTEVPVLLLLNKIDLVKQEEVSRQIEFWKGRRSRFHDRIQFQCDDNGKWTYKRL